MPRDLNLIRMLRQTGTIFLGWAAFIAVAPSPSFGQSDEHSTAATVADQIISVEQADKFLTRTFDDRPLDEAVKNLLQAKALDQLVGELLVIEYLRSEGQLATDSEVEMSIKRLQAELEAVEQTLEQYLADQGLSLNALRNQFQFRLSWAKYLGQKLTADNLRKHFERFRRELDGGQMRVSHLLIKTMPADLDRLESDRNQADQIRGQVLAGQISWSAAVKEHSQAASSDQGGDLGWIERTSPMPESFSAAAFLLEVGQISPPTCSEFGVHLIRCDDIKPGAQNWEQVEARVRTHATQFLFDWIVERQRQRTPPAYSGHYPILDGTTGQVRPASALDKPNIK